HHAFSSGAGRTSDGNGSHASTLKSPSYTKSVSWQHYPISIVIFRKYLSCIGESELDQTFAKFAKDFAHFANFTVPLCDVL
ncbi:hypothetical protein UYH74_23570, partial [Escherichia coli]|nr:hypothetical protein [Escherichia coli]MDY8068302.1 hypothetical protein [Escherichia coli]MDY8105527.1 hypothetical protein [Escherichia coli]MDY8188585.1 hypothetical protein [Escherichia coli]MDY8649451.1 hypothetical protein [Escherichia coli]